METMTKMPKSIRKYIRKEKARIRREFLSVTEQEGKLKELFKRFSIGEKPAKSSKTR